MIRKIIIEMDVTDCFHCKFLNSSDTGENCSILRKGIQEDEWSNIGFQFNEGCGSKKDHKLSKSLSKSDGFLSGSIGFYALSMVYRSSCDQSLVKTDLWP